MARAMTGAHPRRILWLLAAATLIPIGVLSWLGVRIVQYDRDAELQRRREAIDVGARRLALDIDERLQRIEEDLARGEGVALSAEGPVSSPAVPLLYQSSLLLPDEIRAPGFAEAQAAEHQRRDLPAAEAACRKLGRSSNRTVRAAALVSLGAVLRKRGDLAGALQTYADLEAHSDVVVAGLPAALIAHHARCLAVEKAGDPERLRTAALEFSRVLYAGGWRIDRPTFENYQEDVRRWGAPHAPPAEVARAAAALELWQSWRAGRLPDRGRDVLIESAEPALAAWTGGPARPVAWFGTSDDLSAAFGPLAVESSLRVAGQDANGRRLFGEPGVTGATLISLMPSDTRLPFVLSVSPLDATPADRRDRMRRTVLTASLAGTFLLMLGAAYGLHRATTRELGLARQQAEFVSAVSHEFRTPLTSMRHLTDLLATRGVESEERRVHYYDLLSNETERLHRMGR